MKKLIVCLLALVLAGCYNYDQRLALGTEAEVTRICATNSGVHSMRVRSYPGETLAEARTLVEFRCNNGLSGMTEVRSTDGTTTNRGGDSVTQ